LSTRIRRWALAVYLLVASALFLAPIPAPAEAPTYADKVAHVLLLGALAVLLWWNLAAPRWGRAALAVCLAVAYAAAIEILQGFTPFRTRDPADVVAGGIGAVLAVAVAVIFARRARS